MKRVTVVEKLLNGEDVFVIQKLTIIELLSIFQSAPMIVDSHYERDDFQICFL